MYSTELSPWLFSKLKPHMAAKNLQYTISVLPSKKVRLDFESISGDQIANIEDLNSWFNYDKDLNKAESKNAKPKTTKNNKQSEKSIGTLQLNEEQTEEIEYAYELS